MPALITHHIFGEDVAGTLPEGIIDGEESLIAFLLGNQGPDPFTARWTTTPGRARLCHQLGNTMQLTRPTAAFMALRRAVSCLPKSEQAIGRAIVLGILGHYTLDRQAHPFVFWQQFGVIDVDPTLAPASRAIHALIEADLDAWVLWQKRQITIMEQRAASNLMRTERICRAGGALFSSVASEVFGIDIGPDAYGKCLRDYELLYRIIDPKDSVQTRLIGTLETCLRGHSLVHALAHLELRSDECPAANLECHPWTNPFTGEVSATSFADVFDTARLAYPDLAEALVTGDETRLRELVGNLNYEGRPIEDD